MSGFDGMLRSQAQTDQVRMGYDAQRYESMRGIGQAAMQAPGMVIGSMQAMQQMQLAEQQMAIVQRDADMRLALQQQEFQQNGQKLMAMAAIDEADIRREALRSAKLQNDAAEFELTRARKMTEGEPNAIQQMQARVWMSESSARIALASGFVPVIGPDGIPTGSVRDPNAAQRMMENMNTPLTMKELAVSEREAGRLASRAKALDQRKAEADERAATARRKQIDEFIKESAREYTLRPATLAMMREEGGPYTKMADVLEETWRQEEAQFDNPTVQPTTPAVQEQEAQIVWSPMVPQAVRERAMAGLRSPRLDEVLKERGVRRSTLERILRDPNDEMYVYAIELLETIQ